MLDITRILTDDKFRKEVLNYVNDTVVANFWRVEFNSWNNKFAVEAVAPILNKVGAFTANPLVRNIIAQPKSSFNIRQIMDEKKILIVNLTRGIVGEDNAAILGSLLVTKIQLAAMSRADTPVEMRHPFYLYVDEFQNFATDSFATILSEARKYGLSLTVANQYIAQMSQEIRDAIFGNVGTLMSFRLGADDALKMQRYFDPSFNESDLINMHNRHFVISMTIEGEKVRPFSAITLDLPPYSDDFSDTIINHSRSLYARSQETIEQYIHGRYNNDKNQPKPQLSRSPDMPSNTKPVPNLLKSIVQTDYLPTQDVSIPNPPANQAEPAKKKRRRRRRKHTNPDNTANSEISLKDQPDNFEHTFKIR